MAVNLSAIRDLLLPGLRGLNGQYDQIPNRWSKLYDKGTSNMNVERTVALKFLGYAQVKTEGGQTAADNNAGEMFVYNQEHVGIGLMYAITRYAIDDNLYKTQFRPSNLGLQRSFAQTKEVYGANIFNQGTTFNSSVGGDGQPLYSTAHPIVGGTIANRPSVDVDLNESSLLNAMITIQQTWKDNRGLRISGMAEMLAIPPTLQPVAIRLLQTELRPGTANNDVNAIPGTAGGLPKGFVVNEYFTSNYAWFLKTNIPGLLFLQRTPYETDMQVDFTTDNLLVKAFERYSFSYNDWRSTWGTFPTS